MSNLQWRAGQLPGQTQGPGQEEGEEEGPSMEGRAIARPNPSTLWLPPRRPRPFNGGPGNCPAKPEHSPPTNCATPILQWRAGQLPGQTARLIWGD